MAVLAYTENWNGEFKKLSLELVSYANAIAEKIGTQVVCLTVGSVADEKLLELSKFGASKVIVVAGEGLQSFTNQSYTKLITEVASEQNAQVVVFANNAAGESLAPRVSVRLRAGLAPNVVDVPLSVEPLIVRKKAFSGKAFVDFKINSAIKVLTLTQNAYKIIENPKDCSIEKQNFDASPADLAVAPKQLIKSDGKMSISDAEILISAGRGLKGPENWGMVEEMARILGAGTCCSRPVADLGWRPHHEHVGQTGKVVAPNLYVAIGISGAIQHLAGVNGSKVLVAINKDPEAPFFESADYGIVGDAFEIVPRLNAAFKKFKLAQ